MISCSTSSNNCLLYLYLFYSPSFSLFFSTTDLKHNNPCNCSSRLVFTILSSFFLLFKFNLFFPTHDILCTKQNKMVVVVRAGKTLVEFFSLQY